MSAVGIPQGELLEYAIFVHYQPIVGISGMLALENVNCKFSGNGGWMGFLCISLFGEIPWGAVQYSN